jgi:drug/metabolite transporter (DMT)-like permease
MSASIKGHNRGINSALASAFFLGLTPVFGKLAINTGLPPLAVVGLRTLFATLMLMLAILIYKRSFFFIYPAGLLGCLMAGSINGLGSLLFYIALGRIDASLGQAIFALYPLFVALYLWFDHQDTSRLTLFRLSMVVPALLLLTHTNHQPIDMLGVLMMLGASALYALHLPINQRVLYDMPAPTVTFYTLLAMSAVVVPAMIFLRVPSPTPSSAWAALFGLTLVTFLARLTLFVGVKFLGGLQTALLGLGELLVTIFFSYVWLGERLGWLQWLGVILLVISLVLVRFEKPPKWKHTTGGWLGWLRPPGLPGEIPWQTPD